MFVRAIQIIPRKAGFATRPDTGGRRTQPRPPAYRAGFRLRSKHTPGPGRHQRRRRPARRPFGLRRLRRERASPKSFQFRILPKDRRIRIDFVPRVNGCFEGPRANLFVFLRSGAANAFTMRVVVKNRAWVRNNESFTPRRGFFFRQVLNAFNIQHV